MHICDYALGQRGLAACPNPGGRFEGGRCVCLMGAAPPPLPPLATQVANLAGAVGRFVASGLRLASPETLAARTAVCAACPLWIAASRRCSECGCKTQLKLRSAAESCPDDPPRWGPEPA